MCPPRAMTVPPGPAYEGAAVANGVVYVGSGNPYTSGTFNALDAATGAILWRANTGYIESSAAIPLSNKIVYVVSIDGTVRAFDAATGALRWSYATGALFESSPTVANGVVYVVSTNGNLYAQDATSGSLLFQDGGNTAFGSSPSVVNGTVYLGTISGTIRSYNLGQ